VFLVAIEHQQKAIAELREVGACSMGHHSIDREVMPAGCDAMRDDVRSRLIFRFKSHGQERLTTLYKHRGIRC
jgi:hypothetical protein